VTSPAETSNSRVLFVDDEPDLLAAMVRNLRKWPYRISTAIRGSEALDLLRSSEPFAVIVSDLRMPEMDGVSVLGHACEIAPDTVRILFTGTPDLDHAVAAINKGSIFRFITKPCPTTLMALNLNAAIEQHRLITAERVLLEDTLRGSIQALLDILAVASPMAFGRARLIRQSVGMLAVSLGIKDPWQVEVAAMLSQIGSVILPAATLERVYQGRSLSEPEQAMVKRMPGVVAQVLGNIPRLEPVLAILHYQERGFNGSGPPADDVMGKAIPWGARALKVALDIDSLERQGLPVTLAFDTLRGRKGRYDPEILEALAGIRNSAPQSQVSELALPLLRAGMILAQDVRAETGVLVVARGQELTPGLLAKLENYFRPNSVIRVITSETAP
jgi:response regulator RpfG family c-di-GMP phosphodiesterase